MGFHGVIVHPNKHIMKVCWRVNLYSPLGLPHLVIFFSHSKKGFTFRTVLTRFVPFLLSLIIIHGSTTRHLRYSPQQPRRHTAIADLQRFFFLSRFMNLNLLIYVPQLRLFYFFNSSSPSPLFFFFFLSSFDSIQLRFITCFSKP